jgi:hypothetical protein
LELFYCGINSAIGYRELLVSWKCAAVGGKVIGGNSVKKIELSEIQHGAVNELFDEEFRKVLTNIEDENTVPNSTRSISIKIEIKPDKTRRTGEVKVQVTSTLAKVKAAESLLFFDRDDGGNFSAYEDYPTPELPGISEGKGGTVPFPRAAEA